MIKLTATPAQSAAVDRFLRRTEKVQTPCAGQGSAIAALEEAYNRGRRVDALLELTRAYCAGCPLMVSCAEWARGEKYTGLAAGASWHRGQVVAAALPLGDESEAA